MTFGTGGVTSLVVTHLAGLAVKSGFFDGTINAVSDFFGARETFEVGGQIPTLFVITGFTQVLSFIVIFLDLHAIVGVLNTFLGSFIGILNID